MSKIKKLSEIPEEQRKNITKGLVDLISSKLIECKNTINTVSLKYGIQVDIYYKILELDDKEIESVQKKMSESDNKDFLEEQVLNPEKPKNKKTKTKKQKKIKTKK